MQLDLADFNGIVHVQLFDKRSQITALNNDGAPNPTRFKYSETCFSELRA